MDTSLAFRLLLAVALGSVIGLEREASFGHLVPGKAVAHIGKLGGVRTFSIIAFLGGLVGFLSSSADPYLALMITGAFFILVISYYIIASLLTKSTGLTTELAALITFLIGYFITSSMLPIQLIIAITVLLSLILSIKQQVKSLAYGVKKHELNAFLGFAIIALVILPFLPNKPFFLTDIPGVQTMLSAYNIGLGFFEQIEIINPFRLWLIVALITGIDVSGYILGKIVGEKRGILLTSAIGGFISSTSTTQSIAQHSKRGGRTNELVSAAIFANLTSFLQFFILVAPLNPRWLVFITPTILIIVSAALIVGLFFTYKKSRGDEAKVIKKKERQIFSLKSALKFALLLMTIRAMTKVSLAAFGQTGFLLSSVIASLAGLDAIMINLAELAGGPITFLTALMTLLLVNATNLLSKSVYTFLQGKREFAIKFTLSMVIVIATSTLGYILASI